VDSKSSVKPTVKFHGRYADINFHFSTATCGDISKYSSYI